MTSGNSKVWQFLKIGDNYGATHPLWKILATPLLRAYQRASEPLCEWMSWMCRLHVCRWRVFGHLGWPGVSPVPGRPLLAGRWSSLWWLGRHTDWFLCAAGAIHHSSLPHHHRRRLSTTFSTDQLLRVTVCSQFYQESQMSISIRSSGPEEWRGGVKYAEGCTLSR